MIESNPPTPFRGPAAGFQPARLGGFLPQGFSPSSRLGGVSKRVSIIVSVRCNGAGLRYNLGSSLATRCWWLRGEGPLVKQQPRSKARPAACIVVRREACWCSRSPQLGGTAVRLQRFQAIRCGFAKYRIPRKRVMRRCQDTGQERMPVASIGDSLQRLDRAENHGSRESSSSISTVAGLVPLVYTMGSP